MSLASLRTAVAAAVVWLPVVVAGPSPGVQAGVAGVVADRFVSLGVSAGATSDLPGPSPRFIVRLRPASRLDSAAAVQSIVGTASAVVWSDAINGFTATLTGDEVRMLRGDPHVASIEPDTAIYATSDQGNPTWGLDRLDQETLPLDSTYSYGTSGSGVTAYIVDTGIRTTHREFVGRIPRGTYVDYGDGSGVEDCNGHGTHVASTIGGTTYGVAKSVQLVPVKVFSCAGSTTVSAVIAGLDWVISDHTAGTPAVVNMSLGGSASSALDEAVSAVIADGISVVIAAGNDAGDACDFSPGRVTAAITVGASQIDDSTAGYSNYGSCLDVYAPGSNIAAAWIGSDTASTLMSGTSMAASHVTGAVARVLETAPGASPAQVWSMLDAQTVSGELVSTHPGDPNKLVHIAPGWVAPQTQPSAVVPVPTSDTTPRSSGFTALNPTRIFDTRPGEADGAIVVPKTRYDGSNVLSVMIAGAAGVPETNVAAVSLNITVVDPVGPGFITVYPCGDRPLASTLNYVAGETVANASITAVSPEGEVCVFTSTGAYLLADVNGWFATGSGFSPLTPARIFDTRPDQAQGEVVVPKHRSTDVRVNVTAMPEIPTEGVAAVALNVTVVDAVAPGFVTVYPCGDRPLASSLNYLAAETVPNAVITPLSTAGELCLHSSVEAHLLVDVDGWFAAGSGFVGATPVRLLDTRPSETQGAVPVDKQQYGGHAVLKVTVTGTAGVPSSGVAAVSLNVTVVDPVGSGFVTVFPCGDVPTASSLNFVSGQTIANAVVTPLSPTGDVCLYSSVDAHLVADINAWLAV